MNTDMLTQFEGGNARLQFPAREYNMQGAFPAGIMVSGRDILAAPIALCADFSGKEGTWHTQSGHIYAQSEQEVRYSVRTGTENIMLNARVCAEPDGLLWVDFAIVPFGRWRGGLENIAPRLTGLRLDIPLKREVAALYHYWPNEDDGIVQVHNVHNSGTIPPNGLCLPFKPCVWLGCEEAGLAAYIETDEQIEVADRDSVWQVALESDTAILTLRLLDGMPRAWQGREDCWGDPLMPITFSIGLQATPIKPYRVPQQFDRCFHTEASHMYAMDEQQMDDHFAQLAELGVKWRTLHEDWSDIQNYGQPPDEKHLRALTDAAHRHGIKVMTYFGYEMSSLVSDWFEKANTCLVHRAHGTWAGGWQRMPWQRAFMVCYQSDYSQVQLARIAHAMDTYGIDGVYVDNAYIPWGCANAAHGCGYVDSNGNRQVTFPLRALRAHLKQLHALVHARGGIVEAHQSGCVIPMLLSFADSCFDGEQIQHEFAEDAARYAMEGTIRSEFTGRPVGVPMQFLQIAPDYAQGSGLMLLFNVLSKPYNGKELERVQQASAIWRTLDAFGTDNAAFVPYWKGAPVTADAPQALCSVWEKEGKALAVAVNLGTAPVNCTLSGYNQQQPVHLPPLAPVFVEFRIA